MKCLCLDFGQQRTGIAVSDPEGRMAFPRSTLVKRSREQFLSDLLGILALENPDVLVIGLPVDLYGAETLTTRQTRNMIAAIKRRVTLPLYIIEEVLSSHEAQNDLHESGRFGHAARAVLDQQAAVRILESFLALPQEKRRLA